MSELYSVVDAMRAHLEPLRDGFKASNKELADMEGQIINPKMKRHIRCFRMKLKAALKEFNSNAEDTASFYGIETRYPSDSERDKS